MNLIKATFSILIILPSLTFAQDFKDLSCRVQVGEEEAIVLQSQQVNQQDEQALLQVSTKDKSFDYFTITQINPEIEQLFDVHISMSNGLFIHTTMYMHEKLYGSDDILQSLFSFGGNSPSSRVDVVCDLSK